jgi:thiol-disulfide isomerase/thioredoxin
VADRREILVMLGVGVAAAAAGVVAGPWLANSRGDAEALRSARLADLSGKLRTLDEWRGRILVVNFWATWCPPCREEIPALVRAHDRFLPSGVEFVGIAIDQVAKVVEFARNVHISYPLLMADATGLDLMRKLGNPSGGLPFTVVLDRKGSIAHRNLGALTQQKIEDQLGPMLSA